MVTQLEAKIYSQGNLLGPTPNHDTIPPHPKTEAVIHLALTKR